MDLDADVVRDELAPLLFPFISDFRAQVAELHARGLAIERRSAVQVLLLLEHLVGVAVRGAMAMYSSHPKHPIVMAFSSNEYFITLVNDFHRKLANKVCMNVLMALSLSY